MTVADRIAGIGYSSPRSRASSASRTSSGRGTVRGTVRSYVGRHRGWGTAQMSRQRMRYVARHLNTGFSAFAFTAALFR